jgi:hypothetical protein
MFTTLGSLIFTLNLILLMFSLHYESQYMAVKGVHRIKDYGVFLEENEDVIAAPARHENKSARVQPHKISKDDLQVRLYLLYSTLHICNKQKQSSGDDILTHVCLYIHTVETSQVC